MFSLLKVEWQNRLPTKPSYIFAKKSFKAVKSYFLLWTWKCHTTLSNFKREMKQLNQPEQLHLATSYFK